MDGWSNEPLEIPLSTGTRTSSAKPAISTSAESLLLPKAPET